MATNTTYDPINIRDFEKTKLNLNIIGVSKPFVTGVTTNLDLKIVGDQLFTGATIGIQSSSLGDTFNLQIVDIDNVLGYGLNVVLNTFASNFNVLTDTQKQIDFSNNYPAKIKDGLYVRVEYNSTGTIAGKIFANYTMHKVLV